MVYKFKNGDVVICVKNMVFEPITYLHSLTIGNKYTILDRTGGIGECYYLILDDRKSTIYHSEDFFISLSEYREDVISSVLE